MIINAIYDQSDSQLPSGFKTAIAAAVQYLESLFSNPITINIDIGYGEIGGRALNGSIAQGGPLAGAGLSFAQLKGALTKDQKSADDATAIANMGSDPTNGGNFFVSSAEEKALGLVPGNGSAIDGQVGFSSSTPFTYDPNNRAVSGKADFIGLAEHELTHAMGRFPGLQYAPNWYDPLDLFRYSSPGAHVLIGGQPAYFSIDGGNTNLNPFDTMQDYGDWAQSVANDANGYATFDGIALFTPTDIREMDVLGYDLAPGVGAAVAGNFEVTDTSISVSASQSGTLYQGPVIGIQDQYINAISDNLNVTAHVQNSFIHTGSGFDAIDVSQVGGTNVLDGGTNSNFLVGGTGSGSNDTFFVDDRGPSADIWSTVANFHTADSATIFGVTQRGFSSAWVDGQGATGYTGLTLHETAAGVPTASLTLSGYTSADLTNGRLSTTFGTESDGTPYLFVHANS